MRPLAGAEGLELGFEIDRVLARKVRRILEHGHPVGPVAERAGLGRRMGIDAGLQRHMDLLHREPGREVGDLRVAERGRDHRHDLVLAGARAEGLELVADVGRVLAPDMGGDGDAGEAVQPVAGAAETRRHLAGGRIALGRRRLLGGDGLGEENPAQTGQKAKPSHSG